jgi:hypothetical protein
MTDVIWNEPGATVSKTQSWGWIILNAIYDRLSTTSLFKDFKVQRITRALPVQGGLQIPFLGVFRKDDEFNGDFPNMGEIRFKYVFNIGIQIVLQNNDPVQMQMDLDRAAWFIKNQLLRDDTLTNRLQTTLPDNARIEGVLRIREPQDDWGRNATSETPVGVRVMNMTYDLGIVDFEPTEYPDLERMTIKTSWPPGSTPEEQQQIQQVKIVYMFDPDYVPPRLPDVP